MVVLTPIVIRHLARMDSGQVEATLLKLAFYQP